MKLSSNFDHDITLLFCDIDDFCNEYENDLEQNLIGKSPDKCNGTMLSLSEIMTILIIYHYLDMRTFKYYYGFLSTYLKRYFTELPSYNRFVELTKKALVPMTLFCTLRCGKKTGIYYIDSSKLPVCFYKRSGRNKVFKHVASYGKSSVGMFFGLKLHVVINDLGELIAFRVTTGSSHDIKSIETVTSSLKGLLFGDRGYISKDIASKLLERGLRLINRVRSNMKPVRLTKVEKQLLNRRNIIETVFDHLKNGLNVWHTRHRSVLNALTHLITGLACYCLDPLKIKGIEKLDGDFPVAY